MRRDVTGQAAHDEESFDKQFKEVNSFLFLIIQFIGFIMFRFLAPEIFL